MQFDEIYEAGKQDWIKVLRDLSPMLAQRVESDRLSLSHSLHLIGVHTGAFEHTERKTMSIRYMASDDQIFEDKDKAEAHEAELSSMAGLHREVDAYLDTMTWDDTTGRARTREKNSIQRWLAYDIKAHPERYSDTL